MNSHEYFEQLSALAQIGELSPAEVSELEAHLRSCEPCREEYQAYQDIHCHRLPLLHLERREIKNPVLVDAAGIKSVAGQHLNGANRIPTLLSTAQQVHRDLLSKNILVRLPQLAYGLCGVLVLALGIVTIEKREQGSEARTQISGLQNRVSFLNNQLQTPRVIPTKSSETVKEVVSREGEQSARSAVHIRDLEHQLKASRDEVAKLIDQIQASQHSDTALNQRVAEAEQRLQKLSVELQSVSRDRDETSVSLKSREAELQDQKTELQDKKAELLGLELEASALREEVNRDRSLLAASHDITSLMGARNLRIIDVSDVDGNGKTRKAFGRVFFTEGKSLVFYAFDLPDVKPSARPASFQAWGAQGANAPGAKSLGIFFHDDHGSNRWVLKFNDPQVLSEIDSVFVTVEPFGGSKRPTGTPLLPAYLKAELNHP